MRRAAKYRIHEDHVQTVEIGANGWILCECNDEAATRRLCNGEWFE
jgi:hypothetical protein